MWTIGSLTFAAPWALAAALLLPVLWWLLRVIPPPPRRSSFPAIMLLAGLVTPHRSTERTPWWLLALRLLLAALVIGAAADPILNAVPMVFDGPLLLVFDNGWAAGKDWDLRQARAEQLIRQAERHGQTVALVTTAAPADGGPPAVVGPLPASEAVAAARAIEPHPWPTDRAAAARAVDGLPHGRAMRVVWLTDGLKDAGAVALADKLATFGRLELAQPPPSGLAEILLPPPAEATEMTVRLRRGDRSGNKTNTVRAADKAGHSLAVGTVTWTADALEAAITLPMPSELRNQVARLDIDGEATAGAAVLLDGRWQHHPVGLVDDGAGGQTPLLDDLFYAERAVAPFAEPRRGRIDALLLRPLSMIILPDLGALPDDQRRTLRDWVAAGGTLVRLAGPKLAGNPDDLLPVRLRDGGRALGGAMSWTHPMALAPIADGSPFAGLSVPADLRVAQQVLAEPDLDLNGKSWIRLEDGTPLVTGEAVGKGWLVLIHTTAWPGWSNLGLSGLFPQMLQRLLERSRGVAPAVAGRPLPPVELLDGFGRLRPPSAAAQAIAPGLAATPPGPRHPPGYYGGDAERRAVNLGPALGSPVPLPLPAGATASALAAGSAERDLRGSLLVGALCLLLLDMLLLPVMRGAGRATAVAAMLALIAVAPANAADAVAAALQTRLAFVLTGDAAADDTSRAGLSGLSRMVARRTTASLGEPMGVDLERDTLAVFPLIYWPITVRQPALTLAARNAVNDFLRHGGMILIDSRDGGQESARLQQLADGLDIPPLAAVTSDHVLARSFYLLKDEPGRLAGAPVYVAAGGDPANDMVSPVVIGSNDWAGAWAMDRQGVPMFAVVPGGERQREDAFRFGINMVMYALTGSYKADQVHVSAILERLKR